MGLNQTSDLVGLDPDLEPLALNAPGTTPTAALGIASTARDAIPAAWCTVAFDQQCVSRSRGTACDIGALEAAVPLFANGFEGGDTAAWSSVAP